MNYPDSTNKIIVQIGTCHAIDHVYDYIESQQFKIVFGLFIEPNKHSIPHIKNRYQFLTNKIISNIAISTYDGIIPIYFNHYESGDSQHASVRESHLYDHGNNPDIITKVDIPCLTLNTYLNKILSFDENTVIDNLYIDTEGHDCDILLNTDFSKLNIKEIFFEITHTEKAFSGQNTEIYRNTSQHLINSGYKFKDIAVNDGSAIFIKE